MCLGEDVFSSTNSGSRDSFYKIILKKNYWKDYWRRIAQSLSSLISSGDSFFHKYRSEIDEKFENFMKLIDDIFIKRNETFFKAAKTPNEVIWNSRFWGKLFVILGIFKLKMLTGERRGHKIPMKNSEKAVGLPKVPILPDFVVFSFQFINEICQIWSFSWEKKSWTSFIFENFSWIFLFWQEPFFSHFFHSLKDFFESVFFYSNCRVSWLHIIFLNHLQEKLCGIFEENVSFLLKRYSTMSLILQSHVSFLQALFLYLSYLIQTCIWEVVFQKFAVS